MQKMWLRLIGDMIQQEVLAKKYIRFFKDKQANEILVLVGMITLAIVVFASDLIKAILSINLVSLMIFIHQKKKYLYC